MLSKCWLLNYNEFNHTPAENISVVCILYQSHCFLGFEYAVESAKSLVIACALAEKEVSVEKAASLSRLEVEFQVNHVKFP